MNKKLPVRETDQPVYAVRRWDMSPHGLRSITANYTWPGPVVRSAVDPFKTYLALFAWNDKGVTTDPLIMHPISPSRWVYGVVELGGNISVHQYGYRASMMIVRLIVVPEVLGQEGRQSYEARYDCPVVALDAVNFMAAYNAQLAERYALGNLEHELESKSHWCSDFIWRTRQNELMPLGTTSDAHLSRIYQILSWARKNRSRYAGENRHTIRDQVVIQEMLRRRITLESPLTGIASRYGPVKGEPDAQASRGRPRRK